MQDNSQNSNTNLKTLPHDIDVEKALLCCILIDEDFMEKLKEVDLKPEYFYKNEHKYLFEAIINLNIDGKNVDPLTLNDQLIKNSKLNEAGGPVYIADILSTVSTSANLIYYAEIVENKFLLRSLINSGTNIVEEAYQETDEAKNLLDKISTEVFELSEKKNHNSPELLDKTLLDTFAQIEEWSGREGSLSGITTGYKELDELTAGWQKNALIVLAARPGMGKTQLALNFALNATLDQETSIAYFSLEMGKNELAMRLMSMESGISLTKLKQGRLADDEWTKLPMAMDTLKNYKIYVDDSSSLNVLDIRTKCRRLKKDKNISMVMVDYIGLMDTDKNVERHEGVSRISRALKGMARELEIPVMILSQLNREVEKRNDKRPMPSDLRESGAIEQDADLIIMIMRPEVYNIKDDEGNPQEGKSEIIIGKQRSGPTGTVNLYFDKKSLKFVEYDPNTGKYNMT